MLYVLCDYMIVYLYYKVIGSKYISVDSSASEAVSKCIPMVQLGQHNVHKIQPLACFSHNNNQNHEKSALTIALLCVFKKF